MNILVGVFRPGFNSAVGFSSNGAFYHIDWRTQEDFDVLFTRIENRAPIIQNPGLKSVAFMGDEILQQFLTNQRQAANITRLGTFIRRCFGSRNVIFEFGITPRSFENINQHATNFHGQFAGLAASTSNHIGVNFTSPQSNAPLSLVLR